MNVLGIYGSPRNGGNSDILLDAILEETEKQGAETVRIYARKLKISGCVECGSCDDTGECAIKDDMSLVYPMFKNADAIVLSAPMFFYCFPAQVKALIDRAQAMWSLRALTKGKGPVASYDGGAGYLAAVGATRGKTLFDGCEMVAKYFYDALDMEYKGGIFYRRVEEKGAILEHPEAMEQAVNLGAKIIADAS